MAPIKYLILGAGLLASVIADSVSFSEWPANLTPGQPVTLKWVGGSDAVSDRRVDRFMDGTFRKLIMSETQRSLPRLHYEREYLQTSRTFKSSLMMPSMASFHGHRLQISRIATSMPLRSVKATRSITLASFRFRVALMPQHRMTKRRQMP